MIKSISILFFLLSAWQNTLCSQNDTWCAVMTQGAYAQSYDHQPQFPADFIREKWAKKQYIVDLTYNNKEWYVVMSANNFTRQVYYKAKKFPSDWIEQKWNEGFDITKVAFGDNYWVVVMSKGAGLMAESWAKRDNFEDMKKFIKEKWNDGKDIINICYGNGEWVATLAKGADLQRQTYRWNEEFPIEWVNSKYDEGKYITALAYGENMWIVVMSEYSNSKSERYKVSTSFPASFIKSEWDKGKRITALRFNYENDPNKIYEDYFAAGIKATNQQDYDGAIYNYNEALKIKPNSSDALNNRAWVKFLSGQCHGGLADANQSIELQATPYNYHTRASILHCLGRCHEALIDHNKALEMVSKNASFYFADRAASRACLGNLDAAIEDYDRAIAFDDKDKPTYMDAREKLIRQKNSKVKPTITWDYPFNKVTTSDNPNYPIKVCIHSFHTIKNIRLLVNGVTFSSKGLGVEDDCTESLKQSVSLKPGSNELLVQVSTDNGVVESEKRIIEYKAQKGGNYHALMIGVEDYQDLAIGNLEQPIDDCVRFKNTLTDKYSFEEQDVHILKNPTKEQILEKLIYLQEKLTSNDQLLIFYSGHGIVKNEIGYWLPADAKKDNRLRWFSNSELRDYVNSIKTKHTLVIADACFSGSIFTGGFRDITEFACDEMDKVPSRRAMTSGANTIVPDNSVFFKYLIKKLEENDKSCLSAESLYSKIKPAVIYNSPNNHIPQFGVMPQTGDEGGNFIFRQK